MKNIKKILISTLTSLLFVGCSGGMGDGCCGLSAREVTGSGQVKRVIKNTPLLCPDHYMVDISMGVMRDGVGSMSTHDISMFIEDKFVDGLKDAAEKGQLVEFTYDKRRASWCIDEDRLTSFKIVK